MGSYTGPKLRLTRSLGVPIAETAKHLSPRRTTRPGQHGFRPARRSLYGRQLAEKQKLAFYYNIRNKQLQKYMTIASRSKRPTPDVLQELLESRFDNVIRRCGWARTIWQARQMVSHGHFRVNDHKVDRPGFQVSPGDIITVKDKSKAFVKNAIEAADESFVPAWLNTDNNKLEVRVERMPFPEDVRVPFEVEYALVTEFYTR
jgi:small subunit ribosomal protein S4